MSDYEFPDLPSDEELGIADEDGQPVAVAEKEEPPPPGPPSGDSGPVQRAEPGRPWRGPLTLVALLAISWWASPSRTLPEPTPAAAPDTLFSSARALVELVDVARAPRPPGSPEHERVRALLMDRLSDLGLETEVQTTTSMARRGSVLRAATVRNIVARLPGTASTGALLLMAHYDSRALSPGAADDGSGVAAILETLRAVTAGPPLRTDLIVLFTDAEEQGLLGAQAFTDEHRWMADVSVVLNVDMRGGGGPSIMFETGRDNGWIVRAFGEGSPLPSANSLSNEVYRRLPNDTDFTPFREAGKQGLNFAAIGRPALYHQAFDTPSRLQEATLQHQGLHLLGMVRELDGRDLTEVGGPDRAYFSLPVIGLVSYGAGWVPAVGFVLLLAAVLAFVLVRRQGGGVGSAVTGLALCLAATAGAAAAGWALFGWVRPFHPEYGRLAAGAFHREGWYVMAVTAAAFTLVAVLFGVARRKASLPMLSVGAMVVPLLAALYATFAVPMAAMNLQWPVLAGLAGVVVSTGVPGANRVGLIRWGVLLALAVPTLAILVPLIDLLWVAMSFSIAPILGALVVWTLVLLLPLLDVLTQPNRWWAPLTGLVAAAVFTGIGLLLARPSPERPTPTTLVYALDHEASQAFWATPDDDRAAAWVRSRVGILSGEGSLGSFMAPEPPAAPPPDSASATPRPEAPVLHTGPAPLAAAPRPDVFVVRAAAVEGGEAISDSTPASDSTFVSPVELGPAGPSPVDETEVSPSRLTAPFGPVRIGLRSRAGAEMMTVWIPEANGARWFAVNGRPIPDNGDAAAVGIRSVVHWGTPEDALLLDLRPAPGADSVRLVVVEHHFRPGELVEPDYFVRPPDLAPNTLGLTDRAILRSLVTVVLEAPDGGGPAPIPSNGASSDTIPVGSVDTVPPDPSDAAPEEAADTAGTAH